MSPTTVTVTGASIVLNVVGPTPALASVPMTRWWFTPIIPAMYPSPLAAGKVSLAGRHRAQRNYRPSHEIGSEHLGARLPRTNSAPIPTEDMVYTMEYVDHHRGRPLERSIRSVSDWQPRSRQTTIDLPGHAEPQLPSPPQPQTQSPEVAAATPRETPLSAKTTSTNESPFIPPAHGSEEERFWAFPLSWPTSTPDSDFDFKPRFHRGGKTPESSESSDSPDSARSASSTWALYSPSNANSDGSPEEYSPMPNPYGTPLNFNVPGGQISAPAAQTSPLAGLRISMIPLAPGATASIRRPLPIVEASPRLGSSLGFVVDVPPVQRVASRQDRFLDGEFCDSPEQVDHLD